MMLVGFGFKIATPFHVWTPDVYEGAPTPVTAFMAAGPRQQALLRSCACLFCLSICRGNRTDGSRTIHAAWLGALVIIAILTMTVGNVVAIAQNNVKRMLAYSSIAHAGYALITIAAAGARSGTTQRRHRCGDLLSPDLRGDESRRVRRCATHRARDRRAEVEDYNGIGFQSPWLAFALSLFLLSLLGMPLTAGFIGKVMVFRAALDQGYFVLVIIGVLNTAISAYYYLRLIIVMFFRERTTAWNPPRIPASIAVALVITILGVLFLGLFPGRVINALQTKPLVSVSMK